MGNISVDLMPWCINYWALVYASVAERLISSPVSLKGLEVSHLWRVLTHSSLLAFLSNFSDLFSLFSRLTTILCHPMRFPALSFSQRPRSCLCVIQIALKQLPSVQNFPGKTPGKCFSSLVWCSYFFGFLACLSGEWDVTVVVPFQCFEA